MKTAIAICQDCLKVIKGTEEEINQYHVENKFCDCGGQVCACPDCINVAEHIERIGKDQYIDMCPNGFSLTAVNAARQRLASKKGEKA